MMGKKIVEIFKWLVGPYSKPAIREKKNAKRSVAAKRIVKEEKGRRTVATRKKKVARSTSYFAKAEGNPILSPRPEHDWESGQTFNPGAVLAGGTVHFLYRAIGADGVSRFGYAASKDGFVVHERLARHAYEHADTERVFNVFSYFSGGSWGGAEDPRLTAIEEDGAVYMTYTACDKGELRVALTSIPLKDFLKKKWNWRAPTLISPPGEMHKNWVLFPEKINGKYAVLHSVNPEVRVEYADSLDFGEGKFIKSCHGGPPQKDGWDKWVRGAGAPPIKTKDGWLVFYHAMDDDWSKYKVGAMLLDLNDPTKTLYRAKEPVLAPSEEYENSGYKPGVVYATGAVVKDETLFLYYGCADNHVAVATANLPDFLSVLKKSGKPRLSSWNVA